MCRYLIATAALFLLGAGSFPASAARAARPAPIDVQIVAFNDFHGNIESPPDVPTIGLADGTELKQRLGGVSALAAAVQRLRAGHKRTITVSAGDLIGASPLVSAYFLDEPTIDAMNAVGLSLNAVGNHEFDKGPNELTRMQRGGCQKYTTRIPCRLEPFGGARFSFLAANVFDRSGATIFPGSAVRRFGPVRIGFIGMTLQGTGTLVTPAGVAGLTFADEAATANALVPKLKAAGADTIVLLIHQGAKAPTTFQQSGCEGIAGPIFDVMDKLDPAISVIVSGHTHYAYVCKLKRAGAERLLTSGGKYGYLVTDIRLKFDPRTHALRDSSAMNVPVRPELGGDPQIASLVKRYAEAAAPAAARVVGRLRSPAPKSETDEESPAGDLIADAQLAATWPQSRGAADLSFTNATGVRTGLQTQADGTVTYGQIFAVQPFGNNLVVKSLTGAELKDLLEQQFKVENGQPKLASMLLPSSNFRFSYDLSRPEGQRIVSMTLDRKLIDAARRYRVTVNNFLASGGDGFSVFAREKDAQDSGLDLDALEAYLGGNPAIVGGRVTRMETSR
ncbi:bifunctional metallophosphatase/5'-nucleotidase [Sphingomonas limnosediminicola]|uniref:Bifunctional metallophosphatase/5'-nucleotidase n=1 Tax=Sphingomonas limnosediminicola TaxID=940133 RepID=A0ABP7LAR9_9SPHN